MSEENNINLEVQARNLSHLFVPLLQKAKSILLVKGGKTYEGLEFPQLQNETFYIVDKTNNKGYSLEQTTNNLLIREVVFTGENEIYYITSPEKSLSMELTLYNYLYETGVTEQYFEDLELDEEDISVALAMEGLLVFEYLRMPESIVKGSRIVKLQQTVSSLEDVENTHNEYAERLLELEEETDLREFMNNSHLPETFAGILLDFMKHVGIESIAYDVTV